MKRISVLLLSLILVYSGLSCSKPGIPTSMATATSIEQGLPFALFSGKSWKASERAKFVKLHIYPDEIINLSSLEIVPCGSPFTGDANLYLNFDELVVPLKLENGNLKMKLDHTFPARSLTVNFQSNTAVCVKEYNIFDGEGKKVALQSPRIEKIDVKASSTLSPTSSYDVMNMFDSRYEYAWSSDGKGKGVTLKFTFPDDRKIEKIRIWNGYQRSGVHCWSNARLKKMKISGKDYETVVDLKDDMGSQEILLTEPFNGRALTMEVLDVYPGKKYKDLAISELRFFDGERWFMPDPFPRIQQIASANQSAFSKSELIDILDHGLVGQITSGEEEPEGDVYQSGDWKVRLRSDGSFFVGGQTSSNDYYEGSQVFEDFYALGNYNIRKIGKGEMVLSIYGFVRSYREETTMEMDCNGCGRDCNLTDATGNSEKIFQDILSIKKGDDGKYIIKNVSPRKKFLNFNTLEMTLE